MHAKRKMRLTSTKKVLVVARQKRIRERCPRDDNQERDSRPRGGKAGRKGRINKPMSMQHGFDKTAVVAKADVVVGETIVVSELAQKCQ